MNNPMGYSRTKIIGIGKHYSSICCDSATLGSSRVEEPPPSVSNCSATAADAFVGGAADLLVLLSCQSVVSIEPGGMHCAHGCGLFLLPIFCVLIVALLRKTSFPS